jgi:hypothetical protein
MKLKNKKKRVDFLNLFRVIVLLPSDVSPKLLHTAAVELASQETQTPSNKKWLVVEQVVHWTTLEHAAQFSGQLWQVFFVVKKYPVIQVLHSYRLEHFKQLDVQWLLDKQ